MAGGAVTVNNVIMLKLLRFRRCSQDHTSAAEKGTGLIDQSVISAEREAYGF